MSKIDLVNQKLEDHIEQQEKDFKRVEGKIDNIRDNHLAHIYDKINQLDKKIYGAVSAVSVLMTIGYYIIQKYL